MALAEQLERDEQLPAYCDLLKMDEFVNKWAAVCRAKNLTAKKSAADCVALLWDLEWFSVRKTPLTDDFSSLIRRYAPEVSYLCSEIGEDNAVEFLSAGRLMHGALAGWGRFPTNHAGRLIRAPYNNQLSPVVENAAAPPGESTSARASSGSGGGGAGDFVPQHAADVGGPALKRQKTSAANPVIDTITAANDRIHVDYDAICKAVRRTKLTGATFRFIKVSGGPARSSMDATAHELQSETFWKSLDPIGVQYDCHV